MRGPEGWTASRINFRRAVIAEHDARLSALREEGVPPESPERVALIAERRRLSAEQGIDRGELKRSGTLHRGRQPSRRVA